MMKPTSRYLISLALAALTLAGCSSDANEPETDLSRDYPAFTATIGDAVSRAQDQSWERGDAIGISVADRSNVCYTTQGNGTFIVRTDGDRIYFRNDSPETFTAYYPWTALTGGATTIIADTRQQTNQKSFDFLWAQASGSKSEPAVSFNFSHRMAKVVFTVKPGEGMTYEEIKGAALTLAGFRHSGSFNIADGATTTTEATETWAFSNYAVANDAERTLTFSFILFPQTFTAPLKFSASLGRGGNHTLSLAADIDFTAANRVLDDAAAKNEWVAGRQYDLSLTLHKTEISMGQSTINTWTTVRPGSEIVVD